MAEEDAGSGRRGVGRTPSLEVALTAAVKSGAAEWRDEIGTGQSTSGRSEGARLCERKRSAIVEG